MQRVWIFVGAVSVGLGTAVMLSCVRQSVPVHAQATELPAGPGKAIVERACTACHTVDPILGKRANAEEWKNTVDTMVSRGADLKDSEIPIVVKYLADSFPDPNAPNAPKPAGPAASASEAAPAAPAAPAGQAVPAAAPAGSAQPSAAPTELPPGPAKAIVQNKCTVCHGIDYILTKRASPQDWENTVNTMVSRGADLSDAEIPVVVKYLAASFPDKPAANEGVPVSPAPAAPANP